MTSTTDTDLRLQAALQVLFSADTEEDLAEAQEIARRIMGMDDEAITEAMGSVSSDDIRVPGLEQAPTRKQTVDVSESIDPEALEAAHSLAVIYAGAFNTLEIAGEDVEDLAQDADEELDGTGWNLARSRSTGRWVAVRDAAEDDEIDAVPIDEAGGERAPKGGIELEGRHYRGGQFIPAKVVASLPPEEREKLEQAKASAAQASQAKADARRQRGSVDTHTLRNRLAQHADRHGLTDFDRRRAGAAARLLHRHHGELALHRVEELADRLEAALGRIPDDEWNAEGLRANLGQQLARLHAVREGLQSAGVTGEVAKPEPAKPEPTPQEIKRDRSGEPIVFPKPIEGPSGTQLLGYDWKWQPWERYDEHEGGLVPTKISDWEKAERNLQTGKNVVHHFKVKTPDGQTHTVSLESALKMMGYTGGHDEAKVKGLASSVKTLARLRMELDAAEQKHKAYMEAAAETDRKIADMKAPEPERVVTPTGAVKWGMGDAYVFDPSKGEQISPERLRTLQDIWKDRRKAELLPEDAKRYNPVSGSQSLNDLKKRIDAAEKKVADAASVASAAQSATLPPNPSTRPEDAPGFTGTDSQGREWVNGELVAKGEEAAPATAGGETATTAANAGVDSGTNSLDRTGGAGKNPPSGPSGPSGGSGPMKSAEELDRSLPVVHQTAEIFRHDPAKRITAIYPRQIPGSGEFRPYRRGEILFGVTGDPVLITQASGLGTVGERGEGDRVAQEIAYRPLETKELGLLRRAMAWNAYKTPRMAADDMPEPPEYRRQQEILRRIAQGESVEVPAEDRDAISSKLALRYRPKKKPHISDIVPEHLPAVGTKNETLEDAAAATMLYMQMAASGKEVTPDRIRQAKQDATDAIAMAKDFASRLQAKDPEAVAMASEYARQDSGIGKNRPDLYHAGVAMYNRHGPEKSKEFGSSYPGSWARTFQMAERELEDRRAGRNPGILWKQPEKVKTDEPAAVHPDSLLDLSDEHNAAGELDLPPDEKWDKQKRQSASSRPAAARPATAPRRSSSASSTPAKPSLSTRKVQTSQGERYVHTAPVSRGYWDRVHKNKPAYVSVRKDPRTGQWEMSIWGRDADEVAANVEDLKRRGGY